jgi:hypothetical protein
LNFKLGRAPHVILSLCFSVAAVPWPLAPASLLRSSDWLDAARFLCCSTPPAPLHGRSVTSPPRLSCTACQSLSSTPSATPPKAAAAAPFLHISKQRQSTPCCPSSASCPAPSSSLDAAEPRRRHCSRTPRRRLLAEAAPPRAAAATTPFLLLERCCVLSCAGPHSPLFPLRRTPSNAVRRSRRISLSVSQS